MGQTKSQDEPPILVKFLIFSFDKFTLNITVLFSKIFSLLVPYETQLYIIYTIAIELLFVATILP